MRSYPTNSPEAAARIVALVLISDGHVCRSEIETLQRLGVERELGLAPGGFSGVVHTLCEDLLLGAYASASQMCQVDPGLMASLLAEVDDPELQFSVLTLARAAAGADHHMADAEHAVLAAAQRQWRLDEPPPPAAGGSAWASASL